MKAMTNNLCLIKLFVIAFLFFIHPKLSAQPVVDTLGSTKIGFKTLFPEEKFNPQKPYLTQLSPKAVPFVQEYLRKQGKELAKMKTWAKPYFDVYDNILTQHQLPIELKYLSVIESHLQGGLVSWAGAVGPWQLMPYEAKRFGLSTKQPDERMDFFKSTNAAAMLLKELYHQFGDWLLVIAAYNGGANRVKKAIALSHSTNFWELQGLLKEETRNHVKKFIGTHYIFEGGSGLTSITAAEGIELKNQINSKEKTATDSSTATITIKGRFNAQLITDALSIATTDFAIWNPNFGKAMANGEPYQLRLPKDKISLFEAKRNVLLQKSLELLLKGE